MWCKGIGITFMNNYKTVERLTSLHQTRLGMFAFVLLALMTLATSAFAQSNQTSIDAQVNALRAESSALERDISLLEKDLLFPPLTRIEVFLSLADSAEYDLRSVALELDGEEKSFHIYNGTDVEALKMGGLQHFWEGNVALGQHVLNVTFKGKNAKGDAFTKTIKHRFEKEAHGLAFELQAAMASDAINPKFTIEAWGKR